MIYSRFDPDIGKFRYYVGEDFVPPLPPHGRNGLGVSADDATPSLPFGAQEIGTGTEAVGRIAKPGVNTKQLFKWIVYGFAIYGVLAWLNG